MKLLLVACAVAALSLAACGGGSSSSTATSSTTAPAASDTSSPAAIDTSAPGTAASPESSAAPSPTAVATVTVTYTDLSGVFHADEILQLAQLGTFDKTSGAFKPNDVITRRLFVRWLFKANNAIFSGDDSKQFRQATPDDTPAFKDVPARDPDFAYVQGLQNSGVSVGFPDKTFRPDEPLTREQMFAIKSLVDNGGIDKFEKKDLPQAYYQLPPWKDKLDIAPEFVAAIETQTFHDNGKIDNIGRVLGVIATLGPKKKVTRAQAAVALWKFGPHQMYGGQPGDAGQALSPATPTP
jgi:hypothetical protein